MFNRLFNATKIRTSTRLKLISTGLAYKYSKSFFTFKQDQDAAIDKNKQNIIRFPSNKEIEKAFGLPEGCVDAKLELGLMEINFNPYTPSWILKRLEKDVSFYRDKTNRHRFSWLGQEYFLGSTQGRLEVNLCSDIYSELDANCFKGEGVRPTIDFVTFDYTKTLLTRMKFRSDWWEIIRSIQNELDTNGIGFREESSCSSSLLQLDQGGSGTPYLIIYDHHQFSQFIESKLAKLSTALTKSSDYKISMREM